MYLAFYHESPPIVFESLPFQTDADQYQAGDMLTITGVSLCRFTEAPFELRMEFRDDIVMAVAPQQRTGFGKGCFEDLTVQILRIPDHLPPGQYSLHAKAVYQVNPLGTRIAEWHTVPFEVVDAETGP